MLLGNADIPKHPDFRTLYPIGIAHTKSICFLSTEYSQMNHKSLQVVKMLSDAMSLHFIAALLMLWHLSHSLYWEVSTLSSTTFSLKGATWTRETLDNRTMYNLFLNVYSQTIMSHVFDDIGLHVYTVKQRMQCFLH